jgi:hypothetical protein
MAKIGELAFPLEVTLYGSSSPDTRRVAGVLAPLIP